MRKLVSMLIVLFFPLLAYAQETKPVQLADYVSFCLALFSGSPDIPAKASALGLRSAFDVAGARVTIGKSTLQAYKAAQPNHTVITTTTLFADGKDSECIVSNPAGAVGREDLETLESTLHLDGQILTLGAATVGRWEMPNRKPPVLLKVTVSKVVVTLTAQKFEATAKRATLRH
jgi:hypothetical protein